MHYSGCYCHCTCCSISEALFVSSLSWSKFVQTKRRVFIFMWIKAVLMHHVLCVRTETQHTSDYSKACEVTLWTVRTGAKRPETGNCTINSAAWLGKVSERQVCWAINRKLCSRTGWPSIRSDNLRQTDKSLDRAREAGDAVHLAPWIMDKHMTGCTQKFTCNRL